VIHKHKTPHCEGPCAGLLARLSLVCGPRYARHSTHHLSRIKSRKGLLHCFARPNGVYHGTVTAGQAFNTQIQALTNPPSTWSVGSRKRRLYGAEYEQPKGYRKRGVLCLKQLHEDGQL
jgi:hypothetical protein